ncbi:phosphoribosyltransferase [Candidatus Woesearchaeota archaeon]|nr:phosphoribosyltransferase [Candidatus Woesearchaeota archaeon]
MECDKRLTNLIADILKKEFKLSGAQILRTAPDNPKEDNYRPKSKKAHVLGQFQEGQEVREDIGEITFTDVAGREAIYYIAHPYVHSEGMQVETIIKQMRSFARLLKDYNAGVEQLSLVLPVTPYDLNHSVKRREREGLLEVDHLRMFLEDLARDNYNEIITICSHSDKTREIAQDLGMFFRDINPFRSESGVPSPRLGPFLYKNPENTEKRVDYDSQIAKVTPFITWIKNNYKDNMDEIYFVAPDDGSERLLEKIAYACRGDKQHILSILKERLGPGNVKILGVKSSSTAQLEDIQGRTCVFADDKRLSGNTLNEIAYSLKNDHNAGPVVALIAHDQSYDDGILKHTCIDKFVFLETNPRSYAAQLEDDRIERMSMETTARLLSTEIFDSYVKLRDLGEQKVR